MILQGANQLHFVSKDAAVSHCSTKEPQPYQMTASIRPNYLSPGLFTRGRQENGTLRLMLRELAFPTSW